MNSVQKLYDLSFLEQMDDTNFIVEIITLYLQDTENDLFAIKQALINGDTDSVYRTAHKLKSSTGIIQANNFLKILETIEAIAKEGEEIIQLNALIQTARGEFNQLKGPLLLHLAEIQTAA